MLPFDRYGYKGFYNKKNKPVVLNSKAVEGIQLQGGTILGTSRGGADIKFVLHCAPQHTASVGHSDKALRLKI